MVRRSPNIRLGLALTIFVFVLIDVQASDKCRTGCQRSGGGHSHTGAPLLKLQEGTTYKYNYDSKIEVTLSSAEGQKTTTEVKAQVLVTPIKDCNQIIQLQNVQIIGSDGKKYHQLPDVDKPIRINYHDGHLEDSICTVVGDTQNSLNLKRAIASLLQVNQHNGHEIDIFGQCPTDIQQHKEGNSIIIQKTRNLNRCAYRENIRQDILTTAFNLKSEIKSTPLLNGDYFGKIRIKNGIIEQVNIIENYLYMPFSVGDNGAKAQIDTKLQYLGASKGATIKDSCTQPQTILFDDPHPTNSPTSNVNSILAAVKQAAKTIDIVVNENTAKEFINLVKILRVSNKDDLLAVYNQVRAGVGFANKITAKKLFLDALLRAGNGDTLEVAFELLKNKELNKYEQNLVFLSLPLIRHTTESSINKLSELLDNHDYPKRLYLDIGNLIGKHCRQHNCKNLPVIQKVTQKFLQIINDGQPKAKHDETEIIYALKGLKNTGYISDTIVNKLITIVQNTKLTNRLRIQALQTYEIDACNQKLHDNAVNLLKDIQQDSELRINAYLVLTKCPNSKLSTTIKQLLEQEPSYQVGGFIVSHIKQLKASTNPDKEQQKQYLAHLHLPQRYPIDPRKYSYSGEFSYNIETLGLSNSMETNLIYSQDSYVPRSTNFNLTTEIFGHTVNLLELETRQQNLDRLFEHYFGRRGLLRNQNLQQLWNNKAKHLKDLVEDVKERVQKQLRLRRDLNKAEIDTITKQLQQHHHHHNDDVDLDLDLSVRMFGTDVLFLNINDNTKQYTPDVIVDKIVEAINKGVDSIKNFEETLRANLLFLDADLSYPTSTGYPLRLGVEGAANLQLQTSGSIDLRNLFKQDSNLLKLTLVPSANVEITGRLTLDTLLVENGLKIVSTLYSSTGGDLELQLTNTDKILDIKFGLPLEKQNLLTLKHNIVFHTRELGAPEKNQLLKFTQNNDFSICLDQLNQLIGLTLCIDINGPNLQGKNVPILPYPLAGDAKFSIYIEKDDISLYHYHQVLYNRNERFGGELQLETLNKQKQKKVSLQLEGYLIPEKFIKLTLMSPMKTAIIEGKIIMNQQEKSAFLRFTHDKNEYYGKIGVGITGTDNRAIYRPILEYKTPQENGVQQSPHRIDGQVIVEKQSQQHVKYILDNVKIVSPNLPTPITLSGNFGNDNDGIYSNLQLTDGKNSGTLNGRIKFDNNQFKYNAELKNTINPQINFHIKGDLLKTNEEFKQSLQLIHGHDLSSKTNILTLENHMKYHNKGPEDYILLTKNLLKYPLLNVDVKFDLIFKPKQFDYNVNLQYNDIKIGSELETKWNKKHDGIDYDIELELWGLGNRLEAKTKRNVIGEQSKIENSFELNDKKIEINGNVKHHIRPQDIDVGSDLTVKIPQHTAPIKVTSGLKYNPNEFDGYHKVVSGATIYVDIFLKANKAGNSNGAIKINTPNLQINGQLKETKGKGNGDITIQLPQIKQTLKIDTQHTIVHPLYNFLINIYLNDDQTKKITISTQNQLTSTTIDTKNQLDLFGNLLIINLKGNKHGELMNGKINGELEIELPTKHYLLTKLNREMTTQNHQINGNALLTIECRDNKNTPGRKISFNAIARNTNTKEGIYDLTYNFQAENGGGKNLNGDLMIKRQKSGDSMKAEIKTKLTGSLLSQPLEGQFISNYQGYQINSYELSTNYGQSNQLTIKGNYNLVGHGQPLTNDLNINLQTTSKSLRTLRLTTSGTFLKTDKLNLKGTITLYADAQDGVIIDYNGNSELQTTDKDGRIKLNLKYGQNQPISLDAGFKQNLDNNVEKKQLNVDATMKYGDKTIKLDTNLLNLNKNDYRLDGHLITDKDKFGLQSHIKMNDNHEHQQLEMILTSNNQKWTINSDVLLTQPTPSIDIKIKSPQNKLMQFLIKLNKLTSTQFIGELKIINQPKDFLLESQLDADINNVDDFHIKGNMNCPLLKWDKITYDVQNKQGVKTGRRIQILIKSANKNLLQGSTSYTAREENGGKLIVEGSGMFKLKEQQQSANFKYIKHNLNQQQHNEIGVEISFDASLGNKAIDAEFKLTNKQLRMLNSYCEAKKECAYIEIDSKTNDDVNNFNQELEIGVDLRKLGLSHEFGLKAVTNRKNLNLDHKIDIHFQTQENTKYQYTHYLNDKTNGITITTPRRIISLENQINLPQQWYTKGGRLTIEMLLYMDKKNRPNDKSSLISFVNLIPNQRIEHELKFVHPALQRPLIINGNLQQTNNKQCSFELVLDIFAQPQQKLVINGQSNLPEFNENRIVGTQIIEIKSVGLQINIRLDNNLELNRERKLIKSIRTIQYQVGRINYNSAANFELTPQQSSLLLRLNNIDLIKMNNKHHIDKDLIKIDNELTTYGVPTLLGHLEIKNLNTLKLLLSRKNLPNDKLSLTGALIPGQIADVRSEIIKNNQKHELLHASIKLDEANFLKSDYAIQSKNIQELLLKPIKTDVNQQLDETKKLLQKLTDERTKNIDEITTIFKKSTPNLQPLRNYYINEFKLFKDEIAADQTIRDLSEFLHNLLTALTDAFGESFNKLNEFIENLVKSLQDSFTHILKAIDKDLLPKLQELGERLVHLLTNIVDKFTDILLIYLAKLSEIAEKYQPQLKQLATTIGEVSQDLVHVVMKAYDNVRVILIEQWKRFYNELKTQPIFEELRAQYQQYIEQGLPPAEMLINTLRDIQSTIKDIVPLDEFKQLIDIICNYIEKKLQKQPINDLNELDNILQATIKTIRKIIFIITNEYKTPNIDNLNIPKPINLLYKLPKLIAIKFSPFNYLLTENYQNWIDFSLTLINKPRNWIPPFPLYGLVIQGQHIFTFDGKHITFPGQCSYILAHDSVDGNFTIIGTYTNGLLTSITLKQNNDMVTLKKGGNVLLNNQPNELPLRKQQQLAAYRTLEAVHLLGDAGVQIVCGLELTGCSVTVSGYYHGKLNGLLGNGNNEPFDDLTLVNGKIVQSLNDFTNSYKTSSSCQNVQVIEHSIEQHKSVKCDKLFGWESELRLCYPFVNTDNFKLACQHGLAQNIKDTEHAIAIAYVATCNQHGIPIKIPSQFLKCDNSDKLYDFGDKFSVKLPQKSADIVLVVNTEKTNEPLYKEYIQPLVQQLTNELHGKGISDVEYHLMTYGGENQWPTHITVGGKLTFKGKSPNLRFTEEPKHEVFTSGCTYLDGLLEVLRSLGHDVKVLTGETLPGKTYKEAMNYSFRANSIKSVIFVQGAPCESGRFYPLNLLTSLLYRDKTIHRNLITPFKHLTIKESKHSKDIVGFNSDNVFTIGQTKKGTQKLNVELLKELDYDDWCVDSILRNNGNVFVTNNFLQSKGATKKQFIQITSHNIVEQLLNVEQHLDCECKYVTPYTAKNVCEVVGVVEKVPTKKGPSKS